MKMEEKIEIFSFLKVKKGEKRIDFLMNGAILSTIFSLSFINCLAGLTCVVSLT